MTNSSKLMAGAAGLAALALAGPAAAQYPYPYPNTGGGVVGQIIGNVLGYGQYPYGNYGYGQQTYMGSQRAINQCARATEARLNGYRAYDNGYDNPYVTGGYGNYYGVNGRARVLGIDRVDLTRHNRLRVTGVATSGRNYSNPWGYGNYQYNRSYGVPDLRFSCRADITGRVYDVDISQLRYR